MGDEDAKRWKRVAAEARAQAHANVEHCEAVYARLLRACEGILLATEVIADPNAKLGLIDELYTAIRRTVSVGETMEQLEFEVRAIWEASRGN